MALIDSITGSIWFYECQAALSGGNGHVHAHAGQNPELRVLFFRLAELSRSTVQAIFIFDGPRLGIVTGFRTRTGHGYGWSRVRVWV